MVSGEVVQRLKVDLRGRQSTACRRSEKLRRRKSFQKNPGFLYFCVLVLHLGCLCARYMHDVLLLIYLWIFIPNHLNNPNLNSGLSLALVFAE